MYSVCVRASERAKGREEGRTGGGIARGRERARVVDMERGIEIVYEGEFDVDEWCVVCGVCACVRVGIAMDDYAMETWCLRV